MALSESKGQLLTDLLNARMQHTRWVAEVKNNSIPHVEPDHTRCEFGLWLISANKIFGDMAEFKALDPVHITLHQAYAEFINSPEDPLLRTRVISVSHDLIDRIDQLEAKIQNTYS